ncbi:MAG: helix-turn-helix transcriptional regulator, partial [Cyclobacteriaceae bacterium]
LPILLKPKDLDINSPDEQFLADLSKIVDDHIGDSELSADFIAKKLGMSHSVIYKKLKALTGLKLVEFVRDYRLTRATKLLTEFGFSIADTCYKVGFNDRKYFSQVFKKKYDQTPTDYIKNHSKSS